MCTPSSRGTGCAHCNALGIIIVIRPIRKTHVRGVALPETAPRRARREETGVPREDGPAERRSIYLSCAMPYTSARAFINYLLCRHVPRRTSYNCVRSSVSAKRAVCNKAKGKSRRHFQGHAAKKTMTRTNGEEEAEARNSRGQSRWPAMGELRRDNSASPLAQSNRRRPSLNDGPARGKKPSI